MTLVESPTLGLERLQREVQIILIETLNDSITEREAAWGPSDEELANLRGVPYVPTTLEPILPENFYEGHRPSLIEAPVEKYPNVSVLADVAGQAIGDNVDQMTVYSHRLVIEVMVKSADSEEEVNRRVQRTADAVNICMMSNRTIRGVFQEVQAAPTIRLSPVFERPSKTSYGAPFMWQGARMEYTVIKESSLPSGDFSRPASTSALAGVDIDQS